MRSKPYPAGEALLVRDTFECELWSAPAVLGAGAALQGLLPEASLVRRATYRRAIAVPFHFRPLVGAICSSHISTPLGVIYRRALQLLWKAST